MTIVTHFIKMSSVHSSIKNYRIHVSSIKCYNNHFCMPNSVVCLSIYVMNCHIKPFFWRLQFKNYERYIKPKSTNWNVKNKIRGQPFLYVKYFCLSVHLCFELSYEIFVCKCIYKTKFFKEFSAYNSNTIKAREKLIASNESYGSSK